MLLSYYFCCHIIDKIILFCFIDLEIIESCFCLHFTHCVGVWLVAHLQESIDGDASRAGSGASPLIGTAVGPVWAPDKSVAESCLSWFLTSTGPSDVLSQHGGGRWPTDLRQGLSGHGRGMFLAKGGVGDEVAPGAFLQNPGSSSQLDCSSEEQLQRCLPGGSQPLGLPPGNYKDQPFTYAIVHVSHTKRAVWITGH